MNLSIYNYLSNEMTNSIENFLMKNDTQFNPLFSSPIWAKRLEELFDFNFDFLVVCKKQDIIAILLVFEGYRGFSKIEKMPIFFKYITIKLIKFFFSYQVWHNKIVYDKNLSEIEIDEVKEIIYGHIKSKSHKIQESPLHDLDNKYFPNENVFSWGTYILDISNKSYDNVYLNFKRQAKRPIKKSIDLGIYVQTLEANQVQDYAIWLSANQSETGKNNKISREVINQEFEYFKKKGYIYEIFVAYLDGKILGSIGVWGFNSYITEFGVYRSSYSKQNNLYPQDLIKDSIIKFMFEKDITFYDFAGFNPDIDASLKEIAIRQFKKKFNASELIYPLVKS